MYMRGGPFDGSVVRLCLLLTLISCCFATRPLKEKSLETPSWQNEPAKQVENTNLASSRQYPANISGTYKGTWVVQGSNTSARFPDLVKSSGNIIFQLHQIPTSIPEVHYVQGEIVLRDGMYISDGDLHMKLEGVYVRPYGHLQMVLSSSSDPDLLEGEEAEIPAAYQRALQAPSRDSIHGPYKGSNVVEMAKNCKIRMMTQVSPAVWEWRSAVGVRGGHGGWGRAEDGSERPSSEMHGLVESPRGDDDGECFAPLRVNASAVNLEIYYNKAVNYTLMVTFISFLQVLFLIRQMEHSNTQSGAAKVSLLMIGQQAIMDAYLCLLHLTAGIIVESLFNAFATAAFFKFVIFSIFEMRYLLAIWKARRPVSASDGWETMRRELSILYSRFYGFLLGGILVMYQLHSILQYVLLLFYAFWLPQIVTSVARDARRPLHPHYILGITATRLAIPLYTFGCPRNFMRVEPNHAWCLGLTLFMAAQAGVLLLQHFFGARCFIPRQFLPEKYSYYRRADKAAVQIASNDDSSTAVDCVICMAPVEVAQRSSDRMVTPCDHFYHPGCLQRWMDIKMECPTCRRALPPL